MPDNSQKLQLIQAIRQSGYPGSVTEVFQAYDQGQDLIGQWVQQQEQQQQMQEMQQQGPQDPQGMAQGGPSLPPPNRKPDGRVSQPDVNQPLSNDQGHLVQSQTPSDVGIQDLPTGPAQPQRIQAREGGVRKYHTGGTEMTIDDMNQGYGTEHWQKEHHAGGNTETNTNMYNYNDEYNQAGQIDYGLSWGNQGQGFGPIISGEGAKQIGEWGKGVWNKSSNLGKAGIVASGIAAPVAGLAMGLDPTKWFSKTGGVRKSKSYIEKFRNGGGIFRTKKQKEIDALNEKILSGNLEENWDPDVFYEAGAPEDMVFGKNTIIPEITVGGNEEGNKTAMFNNYMQRNTLFGDRASVPTTYYNSLNQTEKDFLLNSYKEGTFNPQDPYAGNNPIVRNIMGKAQQGYGIGDNQTWMESLKTTGTAINPLRIAKQGAEYVYNNPKDAAFLGLDVLAGIGVTAGAAEPLTTGLGAAWLAYRGGDALFKQHKRHKANPELYDPIGFNLETGLNASYFLPGMSTYGRGAKTAFKYGRTLPFKKTGQHLLGQAVTGAKNIGTGAKTTFTKMPFRSTLSRIGDGTSTLPINTKHGIGANLMNRFGNTSLGRTAINNVKSTKKNWNLLTKPRSTPFESPMSKKFFTNQNIIKYPTGPNTFKNIAPGSQINLAGGAYNMFRGGVGTAYHGLKTAMMPLSIYGIGDHLSSPSNFTSLDKNLDFGTDLANTMFGGQLIGDAIKIGTYTAQGKKEKAATQAVGLLSPFKTVTKFKKTYDKIKGFGDPNKFFSQSTTSPLLQPNYSTNLQINPNATSLFKT